jgi:hypothetical protein
MLSAMRQSVGLAVDLAKEDYYRDETPMPAMAVWGFGFSEILDFVIREAISQGKEHRADIEKAGQGAVDALVALDIPYVPEAIEGVIDAAVKQLGYTAIARVLDAVLA